MVQEICNYINENKTFSVSYRKHQSHNMSTNHLHSTYELFYLLSGERRFFIKDRTIVINEGDLVLIKPNILHKTNNSTMATHERIILNFSECFLTTSISMLRDNLNVLFEDEYIIIHFSPTDRIHIEETLLCLIKEVTKKNAAFEIYSSTLLLQLLIYCSRFIQENNKKSLDYINPIHERISDVVRYINKNYYKDLNLQFLSEKFYISSYYLSRVFKEVTGFTFIEYLNSVRIKEAVKLLQESKLKVNIIVEKVGFGSVTHFGRVFKEITGHAPLFYRKNIINKK
jgi:YesN/AraC family two-component response regulator